MREIKFRAWDKSVRGFLLPKHWNIFNFYFDEKNNRQFLKVFYKTVGCYSNPITMDYVMQYTGLKDKNGVEIYEGDIISSGKFSHIIKYDENVARFMAVFNEKTNIYNGCCSMDKNWIEEFGKEVIGNIYENKELLELQND